MFTPALIHADDPCANPGEHTLCSAVCPNQGSCNDCCQTQFNHATDSWWSFIASIKRFLHMAELQSCLNNCASDLDRLGSDVPPPADNRPESRPSGAGARASSALSVISRQTFRPAAGGFGVDYHFSMRDGRSVEIIATSVDMGTSLRGRCEIVGFGGQRLTLLISETAPMVRVETAKGSVIVVVDGRVIDHTNREAFDSVVQSFDARFLGQLRGIAAIRGADDPALDSVATILSELLGSAAH